LGASYTGDVTLGDSVTLGGSFSAESRDLPAWLGEFGIQLPEAANVLENVSVSANLTGALDTLKVSGIELRQVGPLLNAEYLGDVSLGGDGRFQGEVETSSGALRSLLDTVGVEMAPGDTLQSFDVNGAVSGTFSRFSVSGLTAELDDVAAAGDLTFDVSGERPRLSGVLTTGTLDLSSFLGQGGGTSSGTQQQGWSDEKLDLAGLKTMDTDIAIQADKIIIGDIELVEADLSAQLTNGDFNANITSMQAFGGQWAGMFGLDARGDLPELDIDLTGETIQLNSALSALAGLDALSGLGQLRVDVTSRGDSLQALVGGLTGEMDSSLADGALKGINLGQLVRSRDNILESITSGQLALALEPEAETDFTSLLAGLSLNNGVASIDTFNLVSPVMTLDGGGSINLLSQTLDVSIVPTLDTSGQGGGSALQLNGVPVPFKISGSWLSPGISPDMQMLQSLVRQDLTGRVQDQLRGQVGGELGGVIGGLIGGGQTAAPQPAIDNAEPTATADGAAPEAEADPKSLEEELEGRARSEVRDALGGLFGRSSDDDKDEDAEETSD
ncbi:MAG: AsmA-like C-terminal region-containing protein, partial [Pseudomonadota bacterium]